MNRKILIVAPRTNGGITVVVDNYLKGNLNKYNNIVVHESTFERANIIKLYFFIKQFVKAIILISKYNPEVIHIHTSSSGGFYRKSFYIILSKMFQKRTIVHVHPFHFINFINHSNRFRRMYILSVLKYADLIITLTDQIAEELKKITQLKDKEFIVVPNPVDIKEYQCQNLKARDTNTILYLGAIIEKKGVYDLLRAAPIIKKEIEDFRIIYCGNKETEKLRKIVSDGHMSDYIEVNDWVDQEQKRMLLCKSNALILPSYTEGIPNVLLEAMASGTPIITTPVGGITTILRNNINCLFFTPGNIQEMAEKVIHLLRTQRLQEKIAHNNIIEVNRYSADILADKLLNIYKHI